MSRASGPVEDGEGLGQVGERPAEVLGGRDAPRGGVDVAADGGVERLRAGRLAGRRAGRRHPCRRPAGSTRGVRRSRSSRRRPGPPARWRPRRPGHRPGPRRPRPRRRTPRRATGRGTGSCRPSRRTTCARPRARAPRRLGVASKIRLGYSMPPAVVGQQSDRQGLVGEGAEELLEAGDRVHGGVEQLCRRHSPSGSTPVRTTGSPGRLPLRDAELPGRDGDVAGHRLGRRPGAAAVPRLRRFGLGAGDQDGEVLRRRHGDAGVGGGAGRGLAARAARRGPRAQPTPGSQASSGAPLAHQETTVVGAEPVEACRSPSDRVKSSSTSVDSPAASSSVELDDVEAAGVARPGRPRTGRRSTSSPRTASDDQPVARRAPSRGRWGPAGRPARGPAGRA